MHAISVEKSLHVIISILHVCSPLNEFVSAFHCIIQLLKICALIQCDTVLFGSYLNSL